MQICPRDFSATGRWKSYWYGSRHSLLKLFPLLLNAMLTVHIVDPSESYYQDQPREQDFRLCPPIPTLKFSKNLEAYTIYRGLFNIIIVKLYGRSCAKLSVNKIALAYPSFVLTFNCLWRVSFSWIHCPVRLALSLC